jgi:protein-S-isoprenylcysteine O-methyltransferase Ste14
MKLLILLWSAWCLLHSLLITRRFNEWVQRKGGPVQGGYRLFYVLFSSLTLIPLLWYQYSLPQQVLFTWHGPWRILQGLLIGYGMVMFYGGKQVYDTDFFLGISQWRDYRNGKQQKKIPFRCRGILRYVRHPWYSGGLALLWALGPVTDITLPVKITLSFYVLIGTLLEEKKLARDLGRPYLEYCTQVPMLLPRLKKF